MPQIEIIIGLLGSICAASLFFPQVIASYRTKNTQSLAWSGIVLGMITPLLWLTYGIMKNDPFIYVTNSVGLVGATCLCVLKKKYSKYED